MNEAGYLVSVVIPAFQQTDLLRRTVESLLDCDLPPDQFEVIVVDGSPDDTNQKMVEAVAARAPFRLRCVRKAPEGPGPSRNLGAQSTSGTFIAFMDSDCMASPEWLRMGTSAFEDGIGIVQGRTLPDPAGKPSFRTWHLQVEQETPYYETANVFYRRSAFEQGHGFSGDLHPTHDKPMGGEDVVAAWSVIRAGWKTRFEPRALVYHAIVPLPIHRSLFIKHHYVVPWLVAQFPELRRFLVGGVFLSRGHAAVAAGLVADLLLLAFRQFSIPLLAAPWLLYAVLNWREPGKSKGVLRLLRIGAHLVRDTSSVFVMLAGSLKFRCLVL